MHLLKRVRPIKFKNVGITILALLVSILPFVISNSVNQANKAQLELQSQEISTLASNIRDYYSENIIKVVQENNGKVFPSENFRSVHGAIPIPATFSIELGNIFDKVHRDGRIEYEFVSDYPFKNRPAPRNSLSEFQKESISLFRKNPKLKQHSKYSKPGFLSSGQYELATPVIMKESCVSCHNSHPNSIKKDWKVGDVRGIQQVSIKTLRAEGFGNLLMIYLYSAFVAISAIIISNKYRSNWLKERTQSSYLKKLIANEKEVVEKIQFDLNRIKLFETAIENSNVGMAIADMSHPDQAIIYVNQAYCETTGYTKEFAIGRNCRYLQGAETDPNELEKIRKAIQYGLPYMGIITNYKSTGVAFRNQLSLIPIFSENSNKPSYYLSNQVEVHDH